MNKKLRTTKVQINLPGEHAAQWTTDDEALISLCARRGGSFQQQLFSNLPITCSRNKIGRMVEVHQLWLEYGCIIFLHFHWSAFLYHQPWLLLLLLVTTVRLAYPTTRYSTAEMVWLGRWAIVENNVQPLNRNESFIVHCGTRKRVRGWCFRFLLACYWNCNGAEFPSLITHHSGLLRLHFAFSPFIGPYWIALFSDWRAGIRAWNFNKLPGCVARGLL